MAEAEPLDWKEIDVRLGDVEPEVAREVLLDLLMDDISPVIALSRLLLALGGAAETEELLAAVTRRWGRPLDRRLREMAVLLHDHREGCDRVAEMLREHPDPMRMSGPPEEIVATFRRFFDRSVIRNEEASVAAYSLGDPKILSRVTEEVVAQLEDWNLLGPDRSTLEIGCGIGRMQAALSPYIGEAHGIDISPNMVEAAPPRRNRGGAPPPALRGPPERLLLRQLRPRPRRLPRRALRPCLRGGLLPLCPPGRSGGGGDPLPRGGPGPEARRGIRDPPLLLPRQHRGGPRRGPQAQPHRRLRAGDE